MREKLSEKIVASVIKKLLEKRKEKGLSHESVAEIAGVHRSTISLIETRKREPTLLTLLKISNALECDLGQLISSANTENKK